MSKTIYWIDDSTKQMIYVVHGIISEFWKLSSEEPGIMSKIIIFGNASLSPRSEALWTQEDEENFNDELHGYFRQQCRNVDAAGEPNVTFKKNKELIRNFAKILYKADSIKEDKELFQKILDCWSKNNLENEESEEYLEAKELVSQLINKMEIPKGANIGIDLGLIWDDLKDYSVSKRILSMELYYQLKANHKCFLYSTEGDAESITNNWKKKYCSLYNSEEEDNIVIYHRVDMQCKGSEDIINRIEKILE